MMKRILSATACLIAFAGSLSALTVEVQKIQNGQPLPFGYQLTNEGAPDFDPVEYDTSLILYVSDPPYVDYMLPRNDGTIGILANKVGGQFIVETNAEDPGGTAYGSNQWPDPDRWHPVFEWTDGTPFPFGSGYWGVSHSGWASDDESHLVTRVNLASFEEVTIYHWFNDGWAYQGPRGSNHISLTGMNYTITQYAADGSEIASELFIIEQGGAEDFFGDHRMFATGIIKATATAPGDYLIIENLGGSVGFKGMAVAILESETPDWHGYSVDPEGWADTTPWLGWVNVTFDPWIWVVNLGSYNYIGDNSGWVYVPK
ncbi:MAG: hypothetical protein AB3N64_14815 [Puniceicoccaceae bacterium]